ncbi:hypothetical protein XENOCAPTIV_022911 [Xenoophorus captivus]|uniref:Uncharacterized protein n=1 Tax=Xenoophorus captivus TaxID=1517983 RepID=A0ABV0RIK0_9TELE
MWLQMPQGHPVHYTPALQVCVLSRMFNVSAGECGILTHFSSTIFENKVEISHSSAFSFLENTTQVVFNGELSPNLTIHFHFKVTYCNLQKIVYSFVTFKYRFM